MLVRNRVDALLGGDEDLGRAVPARGHVVRKGGVRGTVRARRLAVAGQGASQAEVGDLASAVAVQENVGRLAKRLIKNNNRFSAPVIATA